MNFRLSRKIRRYLVIYVSIAKTVLTTPQDYRRILNYGEGLYKNVPLTDLWLDLPSRTICPFISSHFFGKKDAENLALRDQELCVAAHLFAEEINTESDLVGENLATKGDELYFQDLPIYNKLNISSAKVGEKNRHPLSRHEAVKAIGVM